MADATEYSPQHPSQNMPPSEIFPPCVGVELPVSGKGLFLCPHPFERRPSDFYAGVHIGVYQRSQTIVISNN